MIPKIHVLSTERELIAVVLLICRLFCSRYGFAAAVLFLTQPRYERTILSNPHHGYRDHTVVKAFDFSWSKECNT